MTDKIVFGVDKIKIEHIGEIATKNTPIQVLRDKKFVEKINAGADFIERLLSEDGQVYGVTTGFGDSCTVEIDRELAWQLPVNLVHFHNCGMGEYFTAPQARAIQATRLASLCNGKSGVSYELLAAMEAQLNFDIVPLIPQEGSVGASGDLTPLSYLARSLIGEGDVLVKGELQSAKEAYARFNLSPIRLRPKEGLALMNGTAVMTALACLAFKRSQYLAKLSARISSLACVALKGNAFHFDEALFSVKPHEGQNEIARLMRQDLISEKAPPNSNRLQDRYSIRCAPHVIGVLQDALPFFRQIIETELNSTNDNPVIDPEGGRVLHGGHFYGGHIAFVMDAMKNAVANIADLLDRQLALLMDPKFNNGLPANLSGDTSGSRSINHGFKAVQIAASAFTAEALKLTMPASVFSRSTECHNQDKVSMGTISARDCLRVLQLTEQVAAASVLSVVQGILIRKRDGELDQSKISHAHQKFIDYVMEEFNFVSQDIALDSTLRNFTANIQNQKWDLY